MSSHPWFILGAGSIGCLWAARLQQSSGISPTLIVRNQSLQPEKKVCLTLTQTDQTESTHAVNVATASDINCPIHQLIVCTKAGDAQNAIESVRPLLAHNCDVLLLQNGMGSQQAITDSFPEQNIWTGSTTDGAWMKDSMHVCHAGKGQTIVGSLSQRSPELLLEKLENFPLKIIPNNNIEQVLWQKLAVNCAINGLTALYDCQNGQLLGNDKKAQMDQLIDEFILTSAEVNQSVSDHLHEQVYEVCRVTAANHSSTCMDARLQRKTELAFINGYLLALAENTGVKLPAHQQLMDKLFQKGVRW